MISGGVLVAYKGDSAEVTIPDGVRVIADEVFKDHTEIQKVYLPAGIAATSSDIFPKGTEIINE